MKRPIGIAAGCSIALLGCARVPITGSSATAATRSTGRDDYRRLLEVRVGDFAGAYKVGAPIPVTARITNVGPQDPQCADIYAKHPWASLLPHLTVWVEGAPGLTTGRIALPVENCIVIRQGETFEAQVDLSTVKGTVEFPEPPILSAPGRYAVSVGHENGCISDMGDWTGTLRSRSQTVVIQAKE